ncbi:tetratricopeptide repeat protein [Zooshikella ganghwensis]|uniref:Tetratricopeptide repeat protein n=1 Tax=Zooshikella ganghwensis TaxID=202772 RepID=A0A4P9VTG7_9GAMM|nr:tetratricopeptide repeat protein [Zooshikella ganghwensis]RDH45724.1 tetratricopeptide repeat protein [Zooshikella ganghwensis]
MRLKHLPLWLVISILSPHAVSSTIKTLPYSHPYSFSQQQLINEAKQLLQNKQYTQAKVVIERLYENFPENINYYILLAEVYLHQKKYTEMHELLIKGIDNYPKNARLHAAIARSFSLQQKHQQALRHLLIAEKLDPTLFVAQIDVGDLYMNVFNKPGLAVDYYKRAIALFPSHGGAHFALGAALLRLEKYDEAEKSLLRSNQLSPDRIEPFWALAQSAYLQGHFVEAINRTKTLLSKFPKYSSAFILQGDSYLLQRDWNNALKAYENVEEDNSSNLLAKLKIARVYFLSGQYQKALTAYQSLQEENPENAEIYFHLASLGLSQKKLVSIDRTSEWGRTAVMLDPENKKYRQLLAWIYHAQGKTPEALNLIKEYVSEQSGDANINYQAGILYRDLKNLEKAKYFLLQALSINPDMKDAEQALEQL